MKTSVTSILILLAIAGFGQHSLPAAPHDPVNLHLPDPGAKMRTSAILPAVVLGGFALVAYKAEPSPMAGQLLASAAVMGSTTIYLAGDYRKRKGRRSHQ